MDQRPPTPPSDPQGQDPRPYPPAGQPPVPPQPWRDDGETRGYGPPLDGSPQGQPSAEQASSGAQDASAATGSDPHPPACPSPDDSQYPDPYGYQYPYPYSPYPYGSQYPHPYGYPYAPAGPAEPWTEAAAAWGAPPPPPDQTVFGIGPHCRPGRVPWGWRQVLLALLIAAGPIVALTVLVLFLPQQDVNSQEVGAAAAAFAVVFTILVDGWFMLWAWMFSLRPARLSATSWGLRPVGKTILWLVPVTLVAVLILNAGYQALFRALAGHPTPEQNVVEMFPRSAAGLILFILLAVVAAPFFEEVVFRGFIFQGLASSWGAIPGIVVSAAVFSAIHAQLTVFVPLFILGAALAWVFYYTRSLWTSIALHAVFNAFAVLVWALSG